MQQFFLDALDAGVNIIHGHHPHVLQPVERVWQNGRIGVILHSTGNFISGQGWRVDPTAPEADWSYTGDSAYFRLEIAKTDKGPTITKVITYPIANFRNPAREVLILPLDELAAAPLTMLWKTYYQERLRILEAYVREEDLMTQQVDYFLE